MNRRLLAVAATSVVLSGCSAHASPDAPPSTPDRSPSRAATSAPSLRAIVHDPRATLSDVVVRPGPDGYTVAAWWTTNRHGHVYDAIVVSDDGFASAHYARGGLRAWHRYQRPVVKATGPDLAVFKDLLTAPVISLAPRTRAYVGGGDGATLLPFQVVARSRAGGAWQGFTVPQTHGDRAYTDGQVVLPDGRFLVLLDAWSSDRGSHHGPEQHGLWASDGDDWSSYQPYRPDFSPPLPDPGDITYLGGTPGASRQAPHGIVFLTVDARRLYVSVDGGRTFDVVRDR